MQPDYLSHIASTVGICLLFAAAYLMIAVRSISAQSAIAFAVAFTATAVAWALSAVLPQDEAQDAFTLILLNGCGAIGMIALWCGFWLRAGQPINRWFMAGLLALWLLPVLGVASGGLPIGSQVPFAAGSITLGVLSSAWFMYRKRGKRNAGDLALTIWLVIILPVSLFGLLIGMSSVRSDPNAAWVFYLGFLPTLFTGIGLFTLLGFTLDTINDSNELARTDGLTGLLNRRAFDAELDASVARAERYQRELSLIVLDIDYFKKLNDSFGHPVGDTVLRAIARVLVESSRRGDVVARIGGEEFALILADTPPAAALRLAERIRRAICAASGERIQFSASFGVASVQDTPLSPEALVQAADSALYSAKNAGRNCVRYATDPEREPTALISLVP